MIGTPLSSAPAVGVTEAPLTVTRTSQDNGVGNGTSSAISFLIADEVPFPTPLSCDVLVTVNGASVTPTAGAEESGVPITYANPRDMGSRSTNREVPYSFALPSKISGRAHVRVTAYDGDGNKETISWTLTVQTTTVPTGAVGGIGLAVIGALVLMVVQIRRRRDATPTHD